MLVSLTVPTSLWITRRLCLALLIGLVLPACAPVQDTGVLRIYLARHGQTDWNVEGRLQGDTDTPLNATGRQQAAELAERLKGVPLDAVYSSALQRSRATAEVVHGAVTLIPLAGFNERRLGKFQGQKLARSTVGGASGSATDDPLTEEYDRRSLDPDDGLDGGESLNDFAARVSQAVGDVRSKHSSGTILIVGHGLTNRMILKALLNLTMDDANTIQQANDELYLIEVDRSAAPKLWKLITSKTLREL
jgi:broad specificity phosphatase PhoE